MQHLLEEVIECTSADSGILLGPLHGVRLPTASLAIGKDANLVPIYHTAGQHDTSGSATVQAAKGSHSSNWHRRRIAILPANKGLHLSKDCLLRLHEE